MDAVTIALPNKLDLKGAINFSKTLDELPDSKYYIFDFDNVSWIEPFALLHLSFEIRRCRNHRSKAKFEAINFNKSEACQYAAHMGFFYKSFGLNLTDLEEKANNFHIPIKIINVDKLKQSAIDKNIHIGNEIEAHSRQLACILIQQDTGNLVDTLEYSLREMLRNIVEHSEAKQLAYCGQYWPNQHKVEIAITDVGIGIQKSLELNPYLQISSEQEALYYALMPGISSKMYKGKKRNKNDIWQNSGYGLFMTSELCRKGGSFFICSNNAGLYLTKNKKEEISTKIQGTALRLVFDTNNIHAVSNSLASFREKGEVLAQELEMANITASVASSMLMKEVKTK